MTLVTVGSNRIFQEKGCCIRSQDSSVPYGKDSIDVGVTKLLCYLDIYAHLVNKWPLIREAIMIKKIVSSSISEARDRYAWSWARICPNMEQVAWNMDGFSLPAQAQKKMGKEKHTPYAGIILFRFEGTFSAWSACILGQIASAKADADTPGAFLMSIARFKRKTWYTRTWRKRAFIIETDILTTSIIKRCLYLFDPAKLSTRQQLKMIDFKSPFLTSQYHTEPPRISNRFFKFTSSCKNIPTKYFPF